MLNTIVLQGRLTKDVEMRWTQSGKAVALFTLACNRGENATDFIPCVAWEKTAQFMEQHFHKGEMCLVQGRLQQRNYTDSSGNKRTAYEVIVGNVNFCASKRDAGDYQPASGQTFTELPDDDGELPF